MSNNLFDDAEVISIYTLQEGVYDGVLMDITTLNSDWKKGLISHVTSTSLSKGYEDEIGFNIPNLLDLLNQSNQRLLKDIKNNVELDTFYKVKIELPNGNKQDIFMCLNEINKFTLMLPEDY